MILDSLSNLQAYAGMNPRFPKAIESEYRLEQVAFGAQ